MRTINECCSQEEKLRGQVDRILGMKERRYEQWWSAKGDGDGGMGVIEKEELCEIVI